MDRIEDDVQAALNVIGRRVKLKNRPHDSPIDLSGLDLSDSWLAGAHLEWSYLSWACLDHADISHGGTFRRLSWTTALSQKTHR